MTAPRSQTPKPSAPLQLSSWGPLVRQVRRVLQAYRVILEWLVNLGLAALLALLVSMVIMALWGCPGCPVFPARRAPQDRPAVEGQPGPQVLPYR